MLYLIMCQSWEDVEGLGLIEGPDNLDVRQAERQLIDILRSADTKYEKARVEICRKYGVPYLLALAREFRDKYRRAMEELEQKAPYPDPNKIIREWIDSRPDVSVVSHKTICFKTYEE